VRAARRPGQRLVGWTLFFVWAMSLAGLQGLLTRHSAGSFIPDAALVLSVVVLARAEAGDLGLIVLLTAFARAATSGEPPLVLLTGILGALLAALLLRGAFELSGPLGRTLGTLAAAGFFQAFVLIASDARGAGSTIDFVGAFGSAIPVAIASAIAALVLGPLLARLPGLTPLWSREW